MPFEEKAWHFARLPNGLNCILQGIQRFFLLTGPVICSTNNGKSEKEQGGTISALLL
jgi:hypothetical protein